MTYTLFETIEDLLYYLRGGHAIIETDLDTTDQNIVNVSILGKTIGRIKYKFATIEGEEKKMIAVNNYQYLDFLYVFDDRKKFIVEISQSEDVQDIRISAKSISFIYKDRYAIKLFSRSVDELMIKDLDDPENSTIKFAILPHFSEVFEVLDKNIKEL